MPAKAVRQPTSLLNVPPSSLASQLLQGGGVVWEFLGRRRPAPTLRYHCVFAQRSTAMTASTDTLLNALEHCDMLEIDGLHAFDFSLDEDDNLHIECMDGRAAKRWAFSMAQINAATFDPTLQSWLITGDSGEHRLVLMEAFGGGDDQDETNEDA